MTYPPTEPYRSLCSSFLLIFQPCHIISDPSSKVIILNHTENINDTIIVFKVITFQHNQSPMSFMIPSCYSTSQDVMSSGKCALWLFMDLGSVYEYSQLAELDTCGEHRNKLSFVLQDFSTSGIPQTTINHKISHLQT